MLGTLEETILRAIQHRPDDAYGVTIQQEIETRTERKITLGAIYTTLDRMEKKNFVRSRLGGKTAARGGRPKKLYKILAEGRRALDETELMRQNMRMGLTG